MGKFLGCVWDYWPPLASFEQNTYVRLISLSAFWSWTESRHNSWPRFSRNCRRKSAPFKFGLFSLWIMNAASPAISTILKKNARGQCNVLRFRFYPWCLHLLLNDYLPRQGRREKFRSRGEFSVQLLYLRSILSCEQKKGSSSLNFGPLFEVRAPIWKSGPEGFPPPSPPLDRAVPRC